MATRGRKPLHTAVKILEGDRGKGRRPLNRNEPVPNADQVKCPTWLMPEAKKEWKRLAPSLVAIDLRLFPGLHRFLYQWQWGLISFDSPGDRNAER